MTTFTNWATRTVYHRDEPVRNDPRLLQPVRVRVLRALLVAGEVQPVGARIDLPRFDAESLAAIGKVELL